MQRLQRLHHLQRLQQKASTCAKASASDEMQHLQRLQRICNICNEKRARARASVLHVHFSVCCISVCVVLAFVAFVLQILWYKYLVSRARSEPRCRTHTRPANKSKHLPASTRPEVVTPSYPQVSTHPQGSLPCSQGLHESTAHIHTVSQPSYRPPVTW